MKSIEEYQKLSYQIPDFPVFMQDWYLDAVCGENGWDYIFYSYDHRLIALFPFWMRKKWGIRWIDMPPLVKYMGPIIHPDFREPGWIKKIYDDFAQRLPSTIIFRQNFNPTVTDWLPFYHKNYNQSTAYSFMLKSESREKLREKLHRNVRRNIQKARDQGIRIVLGHETAMLLNLQRKSFERQNLKVPYSDQQFFSIDQALLSKGKRHIFYAQLPNGEITASAYLIHDGDVCYYHISGEDPKYRQFGGGILLLWEAINFSFEKLNCKIFDFEGSMIKGVETIRRQFGAHPYPYFKIKKIRYAWMKILFA